MNQRKQGAQEVCIENENQVVHRLKEGNSPSQFEIG